MERILNLVCPNCKNGIKHDTLMGVTTGIPIEEYPKVDEKTGRCWCKTCQHGTYPDEDGLCTECTGKNRLTRLQPKAVDGNVKEVKEVKELKLPEEEPKEVKIVRNITKVATKNKKSSPTSTKTV